MYHTNLESCQLATRSSTGSPSRGSIAVIKICLKNWSGTFRQFHVNSKVHMLALKVLRQTTVFPGNWSFWALSCKHPRKFDLGKDWPPFCNCSANIRKDSSQSTPSCIVYSILICSRLLMSHSIPTQVTLSSSTSSSYSQSDIPSYIWTEMTLLVHAVHSWL